MSHPGRQLTSLASAQPEPAGAGHQEGQYYIVVVVVVRSLGVFLEAFIGSIYRFNLPNGQMIYLSIYS